MTEQRYVADEAAFESTDRVIATIEGQPIGVIRYEGTYYAIANECAHRNGPVCTGKVSGAIRGEYVDPGERIREYFDDEPAITCPWHGWDFSLESGHHLGDPEESIDTYDVVVEDGQVFVEL